MRSTAPEDGSTIDITAEDENHKFYSAEIREIWRAKKIELREWLENVELTDMSRYFQDTICFYKKRNLLFQQKGKPALPIDQFGILVNVLTNLQLHLTRRSQYDDHGQDQTRLAEAYKQADPVVIQAYIARLMYEMNQLSAYNDLEKVLSRENVMNYFQPRLKELEDKLRVLQESGTSGEGNKEFEDYELMAVFYSSLEDIIRCLMGETCQPKKA